jgi:hypothetical protein
MAQPNSRTTLIDYCLRSLADRNAEAEAMENT